MRTQSFPFVLCLAIVSGAGCERPTGLATKNGDGESKTASITDSRNTGEPDSGDQGNAAAGGKDEAAAPTLAIGDPAPSLAIAQWVKGDEVTSFEPGKIYVVEFWATWCGPCRQSMPHLSELQERFGKDVTFVGVSDEEPATVTAFFEKDFDENRTWSDIVTYRIALDDQRKTTQRFFEAAGQEGIPTAFVVGRDGHIEWIGHPMGLEADLETIVAGTWDRQAAREKYVKEREAQQALMDAVRQIRTALSKNDSEEAIRVITDLSARYPEDDNVSFMMIELLVKAGKVEDGIAAANKLAKKHWDNASLLNSLAWNLVIAGKEGAHATALDIANRANELSQDKDPSVLDTLARAHFEMGHVQEAVDLQQKAVDLSGSDAGVLEQTLKEYRARLEPPAGTETDAAQPTEPDASNTEPPAAEASDTEPPGAEASDAEPAAADVPQENGEASEATPEPPAEEPTQETDE